MTNSIHATAIIDPAAELGNDVTIGPYTVIEAGVSIADGCSIGPLCRITGPTSIGPRNRFEGHCSIGTPPQDLKYKGEPTRLEIGEDNYFREFITLNRGTVGGGGITRVGSHCLFMSYAHVAHDCSVGDFTVFGNNATLAGHVSVGDHVRINAFSAVHQFCRVGPHAFLGGFTVATKDCLPFMKTVGSRPAKCYGPNTMGLEREGFDEPRRRALKLAWRALHSSKLNTSQALEKIRAELGDQKDVQVVIQFIENAERGVILARG